MPSPSSRPAPRAVAAAIPAVAPAAAAASARAALPLAAVVLAFGLLTAFGWTGYLGSDEPQYAKAAIGWNESFPFVGQTVGMLRNTLVLPIALSFRLFGVGEASLVAPIVLHALGVVLLTYLLVARVCGRPTALAAALLVAATPMLAVAASIAAPDPVELFWILASLALLWSPGAGAGRLACAGACAGLAFHTRETTLAYLIALAALAIAGWGQPRGRWGWVALGAALVVAAELAWLGAATGDPLYRWKLDLAHDQVTRAQGYVGVTRAGNYVVGIAWLDPLLVMLANQEFALLFWFGIPAAAWCATTRGLPPEVRRFARALALIGFSWVVFVGAAQRLLFLLPRYFTPACWCAAVLCAIALVRGLGPARPALARAAFALLALSFVAGIYVDNRAHFLPERTLVRYAAGTNEAVYTDPSSALRAEFLIASHPGLASRVRGEAPPPGALYFAIARNAASGRAGRRPFDPAPHLPAEGWTPVWSEDPGRKWSGIALEALGLLGLLPASVRTKLDRPNPVLVVWRVPQRPTGL